MINYYYSTCTYGSTYTHNASCTRFKVSDYVYYSVIIRCGLVVYTYTKFIHNLNTAEANKMSKERSKRKLRFSGSSPPVICSVCHHHHSHTSSPNEWRNQPAKDLALSMSLSTDSLVCGACRDDMRRVLADATYVPRWEKAERVGSNISCFVQNCTEPSFTQSSMCVSKELKSMLSLQFRSESLPNPTPLCKTHYHAVYDVHKSWENNCRTCGTRLRVGNDRPCPQPLDIQKYLCEHTDFEGCISEGDRVCLTCYKSHLFVLKTNKPISTDDDLKSLNDNLRQQATKAHDLIHRATNKMLIEVGRMLLENRAALLPTIHLKFMQCARDLMSESRIQKLPDLQFITSRHILSEIIATFQHHVIYACKVRKYGTLVYRPNSDLVVLLSEALWKMKQINAHVAVQCATEDEHAHTEKDTNTRELCNINKLVHAQIDRYSSKKYHDYDELNLDEQISNISPQLWKVICCITQSKSELRGVSKVDDPHSLAHHVKRARRFFLLCMIMFSIDDKCSVPMHTLMTDLIENQGGSSVLIKILNRLGVCSSADTLARFIQHKRTISEQHQFRHLSNDAFTVVSADNLDFLYSFARVFCGNQKSSWHGTTIQVAQPLPSLSLPSSYEVDTLSFKVQESMSIQGELLISHGLGQGAPESLVPHGNTLTPYGDTLTTHGEAGETITHQGGLRDGPGDRLSGLEDTPTTCGELGSGMEGSHDSEDTPTLCDRPRDSLTPHDELKNLDSYADTLFISGLQNPVSRKRGERPSPLPSPMNRGHAGSYICGPNPTKIQWS